MTATLQYTLSGVTYSRDFEIYGANFLDVHLVRSLKETLNGGYVEDPVGYRYTMKIDFMPLGADMVAADWMRGFMVGTDRSITYTTDTPQVRPCIPLTEFKISFLDKTDFGDAFSMTFAETNLRPVDDDGSRRTIKPSYTPGVDSLAAGVWRVYVDLVDRLSSLTKRKVLSFIDDAVGDVPFVYLGNLMIDFGVIRDPARQLWLIEFLLWRDKSIDTTEIDPVDGQDFPVIFLGPDDVAWGFAQGTKEQGTIALEFVDKIPTAELAPEFFITDETSTSVSMLWRHFPPGTGSYRLERKGPVNSDESPYSPTDWRAVPSSPFGGGPNGTYTDTELLPGYAYEYRITPVNAGVDGATLSDATVTDPGGAMEPLHVGYGGQAGGSGMNEETGLLGGGTAIQPFPEYGTYYGGSFPHHQFTVDFVLRNTGAEASVKSIWARDCIESWGVGSVLTTLAIQKNGTTISVLAYQIGLGVHNFTVSVPAQLGETHHWAFAFDINSAGGLTHYIYVYKDGTLVDTFSWTTGARHRFVFVGGVSLYLYRTTFVLMRDVKGILDEFRVWRQTLTATVVAAITNKVIQTNAALLYRFGFDNYSQLSGAAEFSTSHFGRIIIDPQYNDGVTITDRAGYTAGGGSANLKHVSDPLIAQDMGVTPPAPILLSPANGAIGDIHSLIFTWLSVLADHDEFQLATDSGFTSIVYSNSSVTGQMLVYPGSPLIAGTTYYWRVRAVKGAVTSAYSSTFSFTANLYVTLTMTAPLVSFAAEPFDLSNALKPTDPVKEIADEPFDIFQNLQMTVPTSEIQDI